MRRRCQRHGGWQKLALHDVRFEEAETRTEMRRVDEEEKGIRGRIELAAARGGAGAGDVDADGELDRDGDGDGGSGGTVEVVGDNVADEMHSDTLTHAHTEGREQKQAQGLHDSTHEHGLDREQEHGQEHSDATAAVDDGHGLGDHDHEPVADDEG